MKVFKFGGASVKNADAIRNAAQIIGLYEQPLIVVVSAMGKTTNALEKLWTAYVNHNQTSVSNSLEELFSFHTELIYELKNDKPTAIEKFKGSFNNLVKYLKKEPSEHLAYEYDQIVSFGELWSTLILSDQLSEKGIENRWKDARKIIRTSNHYQEARVDWTKTKELVKRIVTQDFIDTPKLRCVVCH